MHASICSRSDGRRQNIAKCAMRLSTTRNSLFAISRLLLPGLPEYLYALSMADGADRARGGLAGAGPVFSEGTSITGRHGEPYGEIGLVTQQDPFWQAQSGAPDDPQPGNDRGLGTSAEPRPDRPA